MITRFEPGMPASMAPACAWTSGISTSPVRHVLRIAGEQVEEALFGSVVAGGEQVLVLGPVGEAPGDVPFVEGLGIDDSAVEKMIGVRKTADNGANENELTNKRRVLKGEIDGEFSAVGAAHENRASYLSLAEQRGKIFRFRVPGGGSGSAAVAAAVVANGVASSAERGPDLVPYGGMNDAVMNEHHGFGARAALFVVELPAFDVHKGARNGLGGYGRALWRGLSCRSQTQTKACQGQE
jgi:hypothetical protein